MNKNTLKPTTTPSDDCDTSDDVNQFKLFAEQLREHLDVLEERNRCSDEELARLRNEMSLLRQELRELGSENLVLKEQIEETHNEWNQSTTQLQSELYEISDSLSTANLSGADSSRHIRYRQSIRRLREAIRLNLPQQARVLVVSRGDDDLLKLYGRRAAHFPQTSEGVYSGYYPASSLAAIAQLETLRAQGAEYFVFPESAMWWLEDPRYADFRRHLESRYRTVLRDSHIGVIFSLHEQSDRYQFAQAIDECQLRLGRPVSILNWNSNLDLEDTFPDATVFSPLSPESSTLPYLDRSIDLVVVQSGAESNVEEARRVASQAIMLCDNSDANSVWRIEWISNAPAQMPSVSIIIPVHNHAATTAACLASIADTLPKSFRGEIIVVDDASTDDTIALLDEWSAQDVRNLSLRNETNQGFLKSAQLGADAATGDILLFLNNDTVLLPGWLPPLLSVFRDFPDAGVVGGKLLFADGVLQEAGGMIFNDGSAANFGRGSHDLDHFTLKMIREVDYCSGALLATRRSLFEKIGGFDPRYLPAYYEDTDYCFSVKERGYRVYYQPESVVVHLEGVSSGTDLSQGVKQYQVLNQTKFIEKWATVLSKKPKRPDDEFDRPAWDAIALRHFSPNRE